MIWLYLKFWNVILKSSDENVNAVKTGTSTFKTEISLSPRFNSRVSIQNALIIVQTCTYLEYHCFPEYVMLDTQNQDETNIQGAFFQIAFVIYKLLQPQNIVSGQLKMLPAMVAYCK